MPKIKNQQNRDDLTFQQRADLLFRNAGFTVLWDYGYYMAVPYHRNLVIFDDFGPASTEGKSKKPRKWKPSALDRLNQSNQAKRW